MSTIWEFWGQFTPDYLQGLVLTLALTIAGLSAGLPLGVILAMLAQVPSRIVRVLLTIFVELGRGTPALVTLYFVYFGLPQIGLTLTNFAAATVALAYTTGAYTSVIFRAGLSAVSLGQKAACDALGMGTWKTLRYVLLPQTFRIVLPPIIAWSIIMYQGTSLAFTIAVPELLSRAYGAGTLTYRFGPALLLAGIMYSTVSLAALFLARSMQIRPARQHQRQRKSRTRLAKENRQI